MNFVIYISPAKKMKNYDYLPYEKKEYFTNERINLEKYLKSLSLEELNQVYQTSNKILFENYSLLHQDKLPLSPALFSYDGIQFQYLSPNTLTDKALNYLNQHLYIISGLYGLVSPLEGVHVYRLEMMSKINIDGYLTLYDYWGNKIYRVLKEKAPIFINLASEEYNKSITKYQDNDVKIISIKFYQNVNGKLVMRSTEVKAARGDFLRYLALNEIEDINLFKEYRGKNYTYSEKLSSDVEFIFIKN